jgi:hypothetical protein
MSYDQDQMVETLYCELLKYFCLLPPEFMDTVEYGTIAVKALQRVEETILVSSGLEGKI